MKIQDLQKVKTELSMKLKGQNIYGLDSNSFYRRCLSGPEQGTNHGRHDRIEIDIYLL